MDHPINRPRPAVYEDLLALPADVKGEILDGVLYTQPRPRAGHAMISSAAGTDLLGRFQRGRGGPGGWWIVIEPGIELPRSPEFSPDAAGWRRDRMPNPPGDDEAFMLVPDWICEVLSPSNRRYDLTIKRRFYAEIGVRHLWYIDPADRTLTVSRLHTAVDAPPQWLELGVFSGDDRFRAEPFDAVELELGEWWPPSADEAVAAG